MTEYPLYRQAGWEALPGSEWFLWGSLGFSLCVCGWEAYLDYRQARNLHLAASQFGETAKDSPSGAASLGRVPAELSDRVSQADFERAVAYRRDLFFVHRWESAFGAVLGIVAVLCGLLPWLCERSAQTMAWVVGKDWAQDEAVWSWGVVVALTLWETVLGLPFAVWSTFGVEQKHGFNKTTPALFVQDRIVSLMLVLVLSVPLVPALVWIVRWGGPQFYAWVWAFLLVVSVLLLTLYPTLIAPLFNTYTPLQDGPTKTAIEELAQSVRFPLTKLFLVDGSRRSAHSNAYFYGFFNNKRIVLYDTLLQQVNLEELLAILGHEIGHWKMGHVIQGFVVSQLYIFALFLVFSYAQSTPAMFSAFGFAYSPDQPTPVIVGLMLFTQTLWGPVDKALSFIMTVNSRRNEFQADAFAVSLGKGRALQSGLVKISVENLDNLVPDQMYSAYHYSHPPLIERLRAADALMKQSD